MKFSKPSGQWATSPNEDEPQIDNYTYAIVKTSFQSLQQIAVPAKFSQTLEQTLRNKTRKQLHKKQQQRVLRISLSSAAAIIFIIFGAISFVAFHSIPGDNLYALKSFEQQVQYAVMITGEQKTQTARLQLQNALQDLQQEVQQGRSQDNIQQALQVVQSYTQRYLLNYRQLSAAAQAQEKQYYIQINQLEVTTLTTILRQPSIRIKSSATLVMGLLKYGSISISGYKISLQGQTILIQISGQQFNPAIKVVTKPAIAFTVTSIQTNALTLAIASDNWSSQNIRFAFINPDNETAEIIISKPPLQNETTSSYQHTGDHSGHSGASQPTKKPAPPAGKKPIDKKKIKHHSGGGGKIEASKQKTKSQRAS